MDKIKSGGDCAFGFGTWDMREELTENGWPLILPA